MSNKTPRNQKVFTCFPYIFTQASLIFFLVNTTTFVFSTENLNPHEYDHFSTSLTAFFTFPWISVKFLPLFRKTPSSVKNDLPISQLMSKNTSLIRKQYWTDHTALKSTVIDLLPNSYCCSHLNLNMSVK